MPGKLIFITGGIRSGKSTFAEQLTSRLGSDITYLATARAFDEETKHRIELHRERRPHNWTTVEEPLNITQVINEFGDRTDAILLDCLTMLITNMIFASPESEHGENSFQESNNGKDPYQAPDLSRERQAEIINQIERMAQTAKNVSANVVIVSNEVGMTLVSDNFLGRQYQEMVGKANQVVATLADEAYLVVAGCSIDLKKGVNQL